MTFGYYIRTILEMTQYLLISTIYEIYEFHNREPLQIISLLFSFMILLLSVLLMSLVLYLSISKYKINDEKHSLIGELFSGLKMQKKYKMHALMLLIRKTIYVTILVTLMSIPSTSSTSILASLQVIYSIYVIALRPYKERKDNIIEIINEIYFMILLASLIWLNNKSNWSESLTYIYMWIIASNTITIFIIILV